MTCYKIIFQIAAIYAIFGVCFSTHSKCAARLEPKGDTPEDDIDLEKEDSNNTNLLIRYKFVVIIFCRAMNATLEKKKVNTTISLMKELENFKPSTSTDYFDSDYKKIVNYALKSLEIYKNDLTKKRDYREYSKTAHYYRLLSWMLYNLQHPGNEDGAMLYETIINIVQQSYEGKQQPHAKIITRFPNRDIVKRCQNIKTLKALKEFGVQEDCVVEFCLLLDKDGKKVVIDKNIEMPYAEDIELYENILTESVEFRSNIFSTPTGKILEFAYEARNRKTHIRYEPININEINLAENATNSIKHFRDILAFFCRAMEKIMLPLEHTDEVVNYFLQIENFSIREDDGLRKILKVQALCYLFTSLMSEILDIEYKHIKKIREVKMKDTYNHTYFYKLHSWINAYIINIKNTSPEYYESLRIDFHNVIVDSKYYATNMNTNNTVGPPEGKKFIDITTFKDLVNFCESDQTTKVT